MAHEKHTKKIPRKSQCQLHPKNRNPFHANQCFNRSSFAVTKQPRRKTRNICNDLLDPPGRLAEPRGYHFGTLTRDKRRRRCSATFLNPIPDRFIGRSGNEPRSNSYPRGSLTSPPLTTGNAATSGFLADIVNFLSQEFTIDRVPPLGRLAPNSVTSSSSTYCTRSSLAH